MTEIQQKPTRQERQWRRNHQEILDAAASLFMQFGFVGTTMQMIARQADYSVGYLYKHFKSKKELLNEILRSQFEEYEAARKELRSTLTGRPLDILRAELTQICNHVRIQAYLLPLVLSNDTIGRDQIKRRFRRYRREEAELFRTALQQDSIKDCDPDLAAAAFTGMTREMLMHLAETGNLDRIEEIPMLVEELLLAPLTGSKIEDPERN